MGTEPRGIETPMGTEPRVSNGYRAQGGNPLNGRPYNFHGRGRGGYPSNAVSSMNSVDSHREVPPSPSVSHFRETLINATTILSLLLVFCLYSCANGSLQTKELNSQVYQICNVKADSQYIAPPTDHRCEIPEIRKLNEVKIEVYV
uniref:Uncharacterized protein n=1 Tax=Acrobeloides nanus TaxID=290746 RepID=A0A914EEW5_9BILA